MFSFLTLVFGVALGVVLLGEPLDTGFVFGSALVLAGIVLVSTQRGAAPVPGRCRETANRRPPLAMKAQPKRHPA